MLSDFFARKNREHAYGELLPVLDYVELGKGTEKEFGFFVLEDGYIGKMYFINTVPAVNEELQTMMEDIYKLNVPIDTFCQTILWANDDLSRFEENFAKFHGDRQQDPSTNEKLTMMSKKIMEHYKRSSKKGFNKSDCKARVFDCFFLVKVPIKGKYSKPTTAELRQFHEICTDIQESFAKIGLSPTPMDQWQWLHYMQKVHNRRDDACWRNGEMNNNKMYLAREQVQQVGGKIEFTDRRIEIDEKPIAALSVRRFPDAVGFGDMLNLFSDWKFGHSTIWSNFAIILNVHFPDFDKKAKSIRKTRKGMELQSNNKLANWSDSVRWQLRDYNEVFNAMESKGSRLVNLHLQFLVWGDNEDQLTREIARFKKIAKSPAGFELEEDRYLTSPLFLHSLPFGPDTTSMNFINRYMLVPSHVAAFLTPIISASKGNAPHAPIIPFVTRDMSMFGFNPYETDGSMNGIIVAESGSGKSVLINYIVTCLLGSGKKMTRSLLAKLHNMDERELKQLSDQLPDMFGKSGDGGMAVIIDVGYSYKNLCTMLGGTYLEFGSQMEYSLNPFPSIVDWKGSDGQAGMILDLFKLMADPAGRLTRIQETQMASLLQAMWDDHGTDSSVTIFAEYCSRHDLEEVRMVSLMIEPYCEGGMYGDIFTARKAPPSLDNPMIVCELEQLKSLPEVQLLVLMQIINICYRHFFLSDDDPTNRRRKMLVVDECFSFLSGNDSHEGVNPVANFLSSAYRRFRKVEASAWICTQLLSDLTDSEVGRGIAANSVYRFYLYQKSDTIESVKNEKLLSLSDQQFELMKSVRTRKGKFSEIFFQAGDDICEILRFYAPKELLLVYSTDPKDRSDIAYYTGQGYSIEKAVAAVLEDRGYTIDDGLEDKENIFEQYEDMDSDNYECDEVSNG
ncbi:TraC family protein (plasmid) [Vibrio sp. SS-MA-C1-2]|uniref:TraC family protein n=1 Tax=Vibrio sp. SS-MA-C1-2 TaxID=2908646 RepID=UPI001F3F5F70|nr:TraC family protein [Vibrio sp. SS-MA-C1-2]UJF20338.1 TraC family protein [Vibrio sp. SS-MA-C1-2]